MFTFLHYNRLSFNFMFYMCNVPVCLFLSVQPPKSVLAQVHLHPKVPIHTISFNCRDSSANHFLCQLAQDTCGRFHYYHDNGVDLDGPEPWEVCAACCKYLLQLALRCLFRQSEDIRLLRQELETGLQNLEKIGNLRDQCASLAWRNDDVTSTCSR